MTTFADYQAIDAINWGLLKEAARSPLHYQHRRSHPRDDTLAMARGRIAHCIVLEPDAFPLRYVVWDNGRHYGKVWDEFRAVNADKEVLSADEYTRCLAIRDAVHAHPAAAGYLLDGQAEVTLTWTDTETGLACKCRIDWLSPTVLVDFKTTSDVEARTFGRLAARMLYHGQLAYYQMALVANQFPALPVKIIAAEVEPPFDAAVFDVDDDALYAGEEQVRELLRLVADCTRSGTWPGRYPTEQRLELPGWVFADEDDYALMGLVPASAGGGKS